MEINQTGNILISVGAAITLASTIYTVRKPFKAHQFNTFSYIILILLVYSLISKAPCR